MQFDNNSPIWLQIENDMKLKIVQGHYQPGSQVESVRELATIYQVNPNTIVKSTSELEKEGLIQTQRGLGKFVAVDQKQIEQLKRQLAYDNIKTCVETCNKMNVNDDMFDQIVNDVRTNKKIEGKEENNE